MMVSDFLPEEPSPEAKAHFQSPAWCAALFNDPTLQPFGRRNQHGSRHNTFMSKTLNTKDTIIAWQSFRQRGTQYTENVTLISMGGGVNGHVDMCHGGFVGVILDEALGNVAEAERPPEKATVTAYLRIDYNKAVRTPSKVLCRAGVEKKDGRK
ncbi:hypothetical protein LSUE1_G010292, partial [Lachnellula suecica]